MCHKVIRDMQKRRRGKQGEEAYEGMKDIQAALWHNSLIGGVEEGEREMLNHSELCIILRLYRGWCGGVTIKAIGCTEEECAEEEMKCIEGEWNK